VAERECQGPLSTVGRPKSRNPGWLGLRDTRVHGFAFGPPGADGGGGPTLTRASRGAGFSSLSGPSGSPIGTSRAFPDSSRTPDRRANSDGAAPRRRRRRRILLGSGIAVAVAVLLVLWLFGPGLLLYLHGALNCPTHTEAPLGAPGTGFPTPIRHVFVVLMENAAASTVLQQGPFERHLAERYAYAENFYAVAHPSAPNYLALTSGQAWQCGTDAYEVHVTRNLADLVEGAGLEWTAFLESMPTPCHTEDSGAYAVRHNPFAYYADIVSNASRCDARDVNFSAWQADVQTQTFPAFGFLAPNLLHDGHDTGIAAADAWLSGWLSPLLNDSFFNTSVFFILYDEGAGPGVNSGFNGTWGGNVYLTAVSPFARAGFTLSADVTDYNLLTTIEWLLGLGSCGHWDDRALFPPISQLFTVSNASHSAIS
jgi:hypothetical protein